MNIKHLERLSRQIKEAGRLREIYDDNGKIRPSAKALEVDETKYPHEGDSEKWQLAQAQTLLDLAEKFQSELN